MTTRSYEFITGVESAVAPDPSTPTNDNDTISKGWLEGKGFTRDTIHSPVANVTALKAIGTDERSDNMIIFVDSQDSNYYFDSSSGATGDDDLIVAPDSGTGRWLKYGGGSGSGGGSQFEQALFAEKIDVTDNPKAVALSQRECLALTSANSYIDINEGSGEVSVQILTTDQTFLISDLEAGDTIDAEQAYDLCYQIKSKLNASALALTYDCTFNTDRKIIVSASGSFTILLKTGTNGADGTDTGLLKLIGYDDSSDTGSLTSHTADDTIQDATSYTKKAFVIKTDSDYLVKSRNYAGVVDTTTNKASTGIVKTPSSEIAGFTFSQSGDSYYTKSAATTITTGTNDALDWKEGAGAEINSTLTAGTYYRGTDNQVSGYPELRGDIETQLNADGTAGDYVCEFDKINNKFIISSPTQSTTLLFGTGTNVATDCAVTLGYNESDTSSTTTHTADNAIDLAGELAEASDSTNNSVFTGVSTDTENINIEKNYNLSDYDSIYEYAGDFLSTPTSKDYGEEIAFHDEHENSSGQGVRLLCTTTSPATFKFQYKRFTGDSWHDSTTTFPFSPTTAIAYNNHHNGNYYYISRVFVQEDGEMIALLNRYNNTAAKFEVWGAYSTDGGDNWTLCNASAALASSGSTSFYSGGIYAREGKAMIVSNRSDNGDTKIHYSTDSGSGFQTFSSFSCTNNWTYNVPSCALIQYFPNETGAAKHRLITLGRGGATLKYTAVDGNGANEQTGNIGWSTNNYIHGAGIDALGVGNRIVVFNASHSDSSVPIYHAESSEDYASGVLSWNVHSNQDINSGGSAVDGFNGYTSANSIRFFWNIDKRVVVAGSFAALFCGTKANASSKVAGMLFYTKNLTSGTWETPLNVMNSTGDHQEYCIAYIPNNHGVLLACKYLATTARASQLTAGQVISKYIDINGDNSISEFSVEYIDGGEIESGFQGFVTISSAAGGASISWEQYDATYDILMGQKFI